MSVSRSVPSLCLSAKTFACARRWRSVGMLARFALGIVSVADQMAAAQYHELTLGGQQEYLRPHDVHRGLVHKARGMQRDAWRAASSRFSSGAPVSIVVIGGSLAAGSECSTDCAPLAWAADSRLGSQCAYSGRFAAWLARVYPHANVRLVNRALGGMTTAGILPTLREVVAPDGTVPEFLFVDFSVNDANEAQDWSSLLSRGRGVSEHKILEATEVLLRFILRLYPQTATVLFNSWCGAGPHLVPYVNASRHYGVPFVSFHHVVESAGCHCGDVWFAFRMRCLRYDVHECRAPLAVDERRDMLCAITVPRENITVTKRHPWIHPSWYTHQLIADVLGTAWQRLVEDALSSRRVAMAHSGLPEALVPQPQYAVCEEPLSLFDARRPPTHGVTMQNGWSLYEDRHGKPGWIGTGVTGSTLEFVVHFGVSPRLVISYLRGYDLFASVFLSVVGPHGRYRQSIDGHRSDGSNVTQSEVAVFNMKVHWVKGAGFLVRSNATETIRLTLSCVGGARPCKFKVLSVSAC